MNIIDAAWASFLSISAEANSDGWTWDWEDWDSWADPFMVGLGLSAGGGLNKDKSIWPYSTLNKSDFDALPGSQRQCQKSPRQAEDERERYGQVQRLELFAPTMKDNNLVLALYPDNEEMRKFKAWLKTTLPGLDMGALDDDFAQLKVA